MWVRWVTWLLRRKLRSVTVVPGMSGSPILVLESDVMWTSQHRRQVAESLSMAGFRVIILDPGTRFVTVLASSAGT